VAEMKKLFVVAGIILIAISLFGGYMIMMPQKENPKNGPIFYPAEGTEGYIFGTVEQYGHWEHSATGIYQTLDGSIVYGTLWTSESGNWVIIDARGQVPASGGENSPIPMAGQNV
jgi:hypothetical protein